jgi:hypothetical protein
LTRLAVAALLVLRMTALQSASSTCPASVSLTIEAELALDHAEHGLDVRALVVPGQKASGL